MTLNDRVYDICSCECWLSDESWGCEEEAVRRIIVAAAQDDSNFLVPSVKSYTMSDPLSKAPENMELGETYEPPRYKNGEYEIDNQSLAEAVYQYFSDNVEHSYYHGKKWVQSRRDESSLIPWTKDYVMLYVREFFPGLSPKAYNKIYRVLNDIAYWSDDRIKD